MAFIKAILDQDLVHDLIRCLALSKHINDAWSLTVTINRNSNQTDMISRADLHYTDDDQKFFIPDFVGGVVKGSNIETILSALKSLHIIALELYTVSAEPIVNSVFTVIAPVDVSGKGVYRVPIYTHSAHYHRDLGPQKIITEVKDLSDKVPVIHDDKLGIMRHGMAGRWYIRADRQALIYQYWLFDREVNKVEYDEYIKLCRQEVQKQNILLPELNQLISNYIG